MKSQIKIFTLTVLGVILFSNCILAIGNRRTLVKRNPMPYPTDGILSPENHVSVAGTYFRDPSIHYGNASTRLRYSDSMDLFIPHPRCLIKTCFTDL